MQSQISALQARKYLALIIIPASIVVAAVLLILAAHGTGISLPALAIPSIGTIWGLRIFASSRATAISLARKSDFYERGIDRLEDNWRGKGHTGMQYARAHHLYQSDLDILGEGSLFELICTARSEIGAERLASYLLDPPLPEEARARQEAVKELRENDDLRERVAVLGDYQFQNCLAEHLREWLDRPPLKVPHFVPVFLLFSGTASVLLGLCATALPWSAVAFALIPLLATQGGISLVLMRRVRKDIRTLLVLGGDIAILRQGVALLDRQRFRSAKLSNLVECVSLPKAATHIRKLDRLLRAVQRREDMIIYAFSLWLALGTQLVLAAERWREVHQREFENWLDAWAEFEALNALACYSREHPGYKFPELLDGTARFEAEGLCHPLLPRGNCVGNDIALNRSTKFYVVSGSNMAGKSTLLRAIGLNAILASAGAPVRASRLETSVFHVCASLSIEDSLLEGKSKFLAEVERLRDSIRTVESGKPVLFLIDEILSGTNSRDRQIAAEALIRALVAGDSVGTLSTHDLALTGIGENEELQGANVHMQNDDPHEPLAFDYRLKPGISRQTNALALVRMIGIPEVIDLPE